MIWNVSKFGILICVAEVHPENKLYICLTCKIHLCPLCKNMHDKSHFIIDYEQKNKRFSFDSIEEINNSIIFDLKYIISYKNISPEILEYFLKGCVYLFPFALNDEDY